MNRLLLVYLYCVFTCFGNLTNGSVLGNMMQRNDKMYFPKTEIRVKRSTRGHCGQFAPCSCRSKRTVACTKTDCMRELPTQELPRREGDKIQSIIVTR